jgi:type II secretory pathway pseudopilin PulG
LIELLVVIAIIAILAAILFPVFAQAKVAAKGTASLSNAKQTSLSMIMYGADNDDLFVPVGYRDPTAPIGWDPDYIRSWAQIILPYMKNADILLDPLTSPDDYSWGPRDAIIGYYPQYGYAFTVLSPVKGWNQPQPLSQTSLGSVAETVMITAKGTSWKDYSPGWDGGGSLDASFTIGGPWCNMSNGWIDSGVNPTSWCNYVWPGWRNSWGYNAGNGMTFESGGYTGLVSMRKAGKGIVAMADGHAKIMNDSQLAAGTNYSRTLAPADLVINNKSKYLWDAD